MIVLLTFCSLTNRAPWPERHVSEWVRFPFNCTDCFWDFDTLTLIGFLTWIIFFSYRMTQSRFWIDLKVDLSNDLIRWLWVEHSVLWIFPLKNGALDVPLNDQTWRIVVIFEVMKYCSTTSLLKTCRATLKQVKQVKLNIVLMKRIKTNDGIHNIIYNEECDVHDNLVSDIRDHLDLDLSTIHIDEMTCVGCDWYMRCKRWRCNWGDGSCTYECCPLLLKLMRETGNMKHNLFNPWFWVSGLSEVIDAESMTTESAYLARVRQNWGHWPIVSWCSTLTLLLKLLCRSQVLKTSELIWL